MAEGPDERVVEGIVLGHLALGRQPQDLAGEALGVLGAVGLAGVTGRHVEHVVGPEGDPATVVEARRRDPLEDRLGVAEPERAGLSGELVAHDAVVLVGRQVGVEVVLVEGQAEQPTFASRGDVLDGADLPGAAVVSELEDAAGVALADERRLVVDRDGPRGVEVGDDVGRCAAGR